VTFIPGKRHSGQTQRHLNYKANDKELAAQFWQLQQIEQASEEVEYVRPRADLQQMLIDFRDELVGLQSENSEWQSRFDGYSDLKGKYTSLRNEEAKLLQLKHDIDAINRPSIATQ
jgi:hypothetical protein